jgi:hypothetical protein
MNIIPADVDLQVLQRQFGLKTWGGFIVFLPNVFKEPKALFEPFEIVEKPLFDNFGFFDNGIELSHSWILLGIFWPWNAIGIIEMPHGSIHRVLSTKLAALARVVFSMMD